MSPTNSKSADSPGGLDPSDYRPFVERNAGLHDGRLEPTRRAALVEVLDAVAEAVEADAPGLLTRLPGVIGGAMAKFGWLWNGYYTLSNTGDLVLGKSMGPPVCATLEARGGLFRSGMCFDAILMNQCLVKRAGSTWPGYISCDAASGMSTVAGIVVPLRDLAGVPFGVWDLDATQDVEPTDARFFDVLFASLARFRNLPVEELKLP